MTIRTTALNEFEHKCFAELDAWNHTSYLKQRLKVNWGLHAVSGYQRSREEWDWDLDWTGPLNTL